MKWSDKITEEMVREDSFYNKQEYMKYNCPVEVDGPELHYVTITGSIGVDVTGCRGITCEQCWDGEVDE